MIHSFLLGFYKKESIDGYYWDDPEEVNQFQSCDDSELMNHDSWLPAESFLKKQSINGYYWDDSGEVNQFQSWEESGVMKPDSWLPTESFYDVEYKWGLWG